MVISGKIVTYAVRYFAFDELLFRNVLLWDLLIV